MKICKYSALSVNILFALLIISCDVTPPNEEINITTTEEVINDMPKVPTGFDFSTEQQIKVTINDNKPYVKYDVYAYTDEKYFVGMETYTNEEGVTVTDSIFKSDNLNHLVFSGVPYNGVLTQTIKIPKYYNKVYVLRNEHLKFSSVIKSIVNEEVNYTFDETTGKALASKAKAEDFLYCVNGAGELFQVNPLTGAYTFLSNMPMGSFTCAIDQANKVMYSVGKSSPFPLMKYYIETNTWQTVKNIGKGGPRLDYNYRDGLLYFSTGAILYSIDPTTGNFLSTWQINGLHDTSGGDLAFADDGTLFICTFSGLYKLELDQNNEYQSTRISADNLPFSPTSMTFDSNQELWLSNSANSSDLIIMDTQTGGWQYNFGISAGNNTDIGRTINDLTTFRVYSTTQVDVDTDGDGILDQDDAFPDSADKAFEMFTPSKYGLGTIAFEDLWPSTGDYDFNDVAINYKAIAVLNAQNLAVQLDFIFTVKASGAGYVNGFAIEMEGVSPSLIESISGPILRHDFIKTNSNGTEANQENAVVVFFDDAHYLLSKETTISIKFKQPISTNDLGAAPFNPFIIVNKTRGKEVHLPFRHTTSLGQKSFEIDGVNKDPNGNYVSDSGLPWGISVIHDFKVPKEKISINKSYNFFNQWASSAGNLYQDWYKDNPGYRNTNLLDN